MYLSSLHSSNDRLSFTKVEIEMIPFVYILVLGIESIDDAKC